MATVTEKKSTEVSEVNFWKSRKFWFTMMGMIAFLTLALTRTMTFTNEEALTIILSLVGGNIVAHTATDIASLLSRRGILRLGASKPSDESAKGSSGKEGEE